MNKHIKNFVWVVLVIIAFTGLVYATTTVTDIDITTENITTNNLTVLDYFTVDTNTFFVDANNDMIGIGTLSPDEIIDIRATLGTSWDADFSLTSADTQASSIYFRRSRGTVDSPLIVQDGDRIGAFSFKAWDGSSWINTAYLRVVMDGTVDGTSTPSYLEFWTTPESSKTYVARMRVNPSGNVSIANNLCVGCSLGTDEENSLHVEGEGNFTENVTADYYFGSGAELYDVNSTVVELDPIWQGNSSRIIAIPSNCSVGEYVTNVTTGGVQCSTPAGGGADCSVLGSCSPNVTYMDYGNVGDFNVTGTTYLYGNLRIPQANFIYTGTDIWIRRWAGNKANAMGEEAGVDQQYGTYIGDEAGKLSSAIRQTSIGYRSGYSNTGPFSSALGYYALFQNVGSSTTAMGYQAGQANLGNYGTFVGYAAGSGNTETYVVAFGHSSGTGNTGQGVTAVGAFSAQSNTGFSIMVLGYGAGQDNTGIHLVGLGHQSAKDNKGNYSLGAGYESLERNSGNSVVALGYRAGQDNTLNNQFIVKQSIVNAVPLMQGDFATGNIDFAGNGNFSGNVTADNVFIPQYIFSHTNATIPVISADNWTNITFAQEEPDIKSGISHTYNDVTNHTFTIMEDGVYNFDYDLDVEDTSVSASNIDVAGRVILSNGTEIFGSVFETDVSKQGAETELSHNFLAICNAGDQLVFQFIATDGDVQISTHGTFGDHPESATIVINKIANLV